MTTFALYRFFNAEGALLYVGLTTNPSQRFTKHKGDKSWWKQIARIEMQHFDDLEALRDAERAAIANERPTYNLRLNGGNKHLVDAVSTSTDHKTGLVGRWFHSWKPEPDEQGHKQPAWQGEILERITDEQFLVQLYSWWDGAPATSQIVALGDMTAWTFYESAEQMQIALGCSEYFSGSSARDFRRPEGLCRKTATYRTSCGNYVCGGCVDFYSSVTAVA